MSAYRVVQEALTNALKYADGPVRLRVARAAGPAADLVRERGRTRPERNGSGLGLQGMAERVAMLGGTLRSGSTADDRFEVDVDIPLPSEGAT